MKKYFDVKIIVIIGIMVGIGAMMLFGYNVQNTLDAKLYYTFDFVKEFFNTLSLEDRQAYLKHEYLDMGFMLAYTAFFFLSLKRFYEGWNWVPSIALAALVFDVAETGLIILCLQGHVLPEQLFFLGWLTACKWLGVAVTFCFFVVGALKRLSVKTT
ncbi:hypothetical protein A11Q_379 [Pseudobdellovibrio exovorus JSS]|uniref:Uncharacterized protein n=2 Tax=Pseudobdellovibrio exovorus TaxID=453816 RepID=M4VND1_9BACT|nr:hypothetical protein A11Q_379 [Pseudobdellovibrio exovorus JSS]